MLSACDSVAGRLWTVVYARGQRSTGSMGENAGLHAAAVAEPEPLQVEESGHDV
jgi:hypothetical protein